jgi:hypothetical protein
MIVLATVETWSRKLIENLKKDYGRNLCPRKPQPVLDYLSRKWG